MERRKRIILALLLIVGVRNYYRIVGNENVRTVEFLSVFAIGAISSLLIREIATMIKNKPS